jgi:membrane protein implicated in regulation of membrane protease activity
MVEALLWTLLGVVLVVAEIFTTTLFVLPLAVGAFVAAGAAALDAPVAVQALVFAVVSAVSLIAVRPLIQRRRRAALDSVAMPFGVQAIEGSDALVLERVDAAGGLVKIDGELWRARAFDATQAFEPGERVRVIEIKGATAMVWRDE